MRQRVHAKQRTLYVVRVAAATRSDRREMRPLEKALARQVRETLAQARVDMVISRYGTKKRASDVSALFPLALDIRFCQA